MSRAAERVSYNLVAETCPDVDSHADIFISAIKSITGKLRDALVEKCDECLDLEEKVNILKDELADANDKIERLNRDLEAWENTQ